MRNKGTQGQFSPLADTFSDRLVSLIDERGKGNDAQIARDMNVTPQQLNTWIKGTVPRADRLCMIADFFGVSVDYLLGREAASDDPFTTAGQIVGAVEKIEDAISTEITIDKAEPPVLFANKKGVYKQVTEYGSEEEPVEVEILHLRLACLPVVEYFRERNRALRMYDDDDDEARKVILQHFRNKAEAAPLDGESHDHFLDGQGPQPMNYKALRERIQAKGYTPQTLAAAADIPYSTMMRRLRGESEFNAREINHIATALDLMTDEVEFLRIFFPDYLAERSQNNAEA